MCDTEKQDTKKNDIIKANLNTQITTMKVVLFNSHSVKIQYLDNNIWFAGADIAKAIGYKNGIQAIIKNVSSKYTCEIYLGNKGRKPVFISESGLFELTLKSSLLTLTIFQRWVYKHILPISYSVEQLANHQTSPVIDVMIEFLLASTTKESSILIERQFKVEDIVLVDYGGGCQYKAIVLDFLHIFIYVKFLDTNKNSFMVASQLLRVEANL